MNNETMTLFEEMDYPQNKAGVLRYADARHADHTLLESVIKIPARTYRDSVEILRAIDRVGHGPEDDDRVYLHDYIAVVGDDGFDSQPMHRISADPNEFRASARSSRRSIDDGRDD